MVSRGRKRRLYDKAVPSPSLKDSSITEYYLARFTTVMEVSICYISVSL